MALLRYLVSLLQRMLEIAKLVVAKYMAIYSIDCIDERGCTSQQLYAKKKGRYSIHCVTHSSPDARGLAPMKPGNHAGSTKSYQDEWPWDDQAQVVLMDRRAMPSEQQHSHNLPYQQHDKP